MTRWLRIVLAAQLAFFALWGARLLTSHRDADVVWLATDPVDPRDLLSGNYVALRYRIAAPELPECQGLRGTPHPAPVYVQLAPTGGTVMTADGPVVISEVVTCQNELPRPSRGERWIVGRVGTERRDQIGYGIERFYVAETSPLRAAGSGTVVAKVTINKRFEPRLVGLVALR